MDECRWCGGTLDCCNESEIVCPSCGEADCWPRFDELIESDLDDVDLDFDVVLSDDPNEEDTS